jgi:segregation and condensation protein A
MLLPESETFVLDNFEGPLDLLWHLINRQEIDIYEIPIIQITKQYLARCQQAADADLDGGAEFIAMAATLVWFKSKTLLPKHEQTEDAVVDEEGDPRFEIIHQLIDYCRFKDAAKELTLREQQQGAFYPRGVEAGEVKKNLGINHLSLEDLATLFQEILAKAQPRTGIIHEEEWKVSDKIKFLRQMLHKNKTAAFTHVFQSGMGRIELIVTFLALLEMMKSGEARVAKDPDKQMIFIYGT